MSTTINPTPQENSRRTSKAISSRPFLQQIRFVSHQQNSQRGGNVVEREPGDICHHLFGYALHMSHSSSQFMGYYQLFSNQTSSQFLDFSVILNTFQHMSCQCTGSRHVHSLITAHCAHSIAFSPQFTSIQFTSGQPSVEDTFRADCVISIVLFNTYFVLKMYFIFNC